MDRLPDGSYKYLDLVEPRVRHPVLFNPFFCRDDVDVGGDAQAFQFFGGTVVHAPVKHHHLSAIDFHLHIVRGLFCMQMSFEQIRFPLHKDCCYLCSKFPGIGDPRTGDKEQYVVIRNMSHPTMWLTYQPSPGLLVLLL